MSGIDYVKEKNQAARNKILARLLESAEEGPEIQPAVAFPAYIPSVKCVKYAENGGLWVMLQIPPQFTQEYYLTMCGLASKPLACTLEEIDPAAIDA